MDRILVLFGSHGKLDHITNFWDRILPLLGSHFNTFSDRILVLLGSDFGILVLLDRILVLLESHFSTLRIAC